MPLTSLLYHLNYRSQHKRYKSYRLNKAPRQQNKYRPYLTILVKGFTCQDQEYSFLRCDFDAFIKKINQGILLINFRIIFKSKEEVI